MKRLKNMDSELKGIETTIIIIIRNIFINFSNKKFHCNSNSLLNDEREIYVQD